MHLMLPRNYQSRLPLTSGHRGVPSGASSGPPSHTECSGCWPPVVPPSPDLRYLDSGLPSDRGGKPPPKCPPTVATSAGAAAVARNRRSSQDRRRSDKPPKMPLSRRLPGQRLVLECLRNKIEHGATARAKADLPRVRQGAGHERKRATPTPSNVSRDPGIDRQPRPQVEKRRSSSAMPCYSQGTG